MKSQYGLTRVTIILSVHMRFKFPEKTFLNYYENCNHEINYPHTYNDKNYIIWYSKPDIFAEHGIREWQYRCRKAVADGRVGGLVVRVAISFLYQSQTVLLGVVNAKQRRQPFVVRDVLYECGHDFLGLPENLFVGPVRV